MSAVLAGMHFNNFIKVEPTEYQFTLDNSNAPEIFGKNTDVTATSLGNKLTFNYVGASSSNGNHMALAAGGYIQNTKELLDLTSLTVAGNGSFKLYTGFEAYTHVKAFTLTDNSQAFNLNNVAYFKLEAVTASTVASLRGNYKCSEIEMPETSFGATADPVYDATNWNRLVHDVDLTRSFEYSMTFYEKTDVATRTSRPSFWVYPADNAYDENDNIVVTNSTNYFNAGNYYKIRQDNFQCLQTSGTKTELGITTADNGVFNEGVSVKSTSEDGYIGGDTTKMARITRDCKVEVIFKLENKVDGEDVSYQEWTVTMKFDSVSKVNGTDYSGHYEQVYKAASTSGRIFQWNKMGIAMACNSSWVSGTDSNFTILDASSSGVR